VSSHPERKSGFMKWLSKLFKGGSNRGRSGRHHYDPAEDGMSWRAPSRALVNTTTQFHFSSIIYNVMILVCYE